MIRSLFLIVALAVITSATPTLRTTLHQLSGEDVIGTFGVADSVGISCPITITHEDTVNADGIIPHTAIKMNGKQCPDALSMNVFTDAASAANAVPDAATKEAIQVYAKSIPQIVYGVELSGRTCNRAGGPTFSFSANSLIMIFKPDSDINVAGVPFKALRRAMVIIDPESGICYYKARRPSAPAPVVPGPGTGTTDPSPTPDSGSGTADPASTPDVGGETTDPSPTPGSSSGTTDPVSTPDAGGETADPSPTPASGSGTADPASTPDAGSETADPSPTPGSGSGTTDPASTPDAGGETADPSPTPDSDSAGTDPASVPGAASEATTPTPTPESGSDSGAVDTSPGTGGDGSATDDTGGDGTASDDTGGDGTASDDTGGDGAATDDNGAVASPEDDGSVCFPADATVEMEDGSVKIMANIHLGDRVKVADGIFSDVFMFTHKEATTLHKFVEIYTKSGASLAVTSSHYIYINDALAAASTVQVGDVLQLGCGSNTVVNRVNYVDKVGLYNPQTVHGDIIVNSLRASTYTRTVDPAAAQALMAPLRMLYKVFGWSGSFLDSGSDCIADLLPRGQAALYAA